MDTAATPPAVARPAATQIARRVFFGNPSRASATISPDGRHIAFLAPVDGVLNIWVAPTGDIDQARPLSQETTRPILQLFWAPDSSRILYPQDKGGTEDFLLYAVDLEGRTTALTPFEKTRVQVIRLSAKVKDAILIGLNNRDQQYHDVWRLEPATGKLTEVWRNTGGYAGVTADADLNLVLASKSTPDGGSEVFRFGPGGELTSLLSWGLDDNLTTAPAWAIDAHRIYLMDSRGRDKAAISLLDAATGQTRVIAEDDQADIGSAIDDPTTGEMELYSVTYLKRRWVGVSDAAKADIAYLDAQAGGHWSILSHSYDNRYWTLSIETAGSPAVNYLYERPTKTLTRLFSTWPDLEGQTLAPMHARWRSAPAMA
jgi:hypothetical protein